MVQIRLMAAPQNHFIVELDDSQAQKLRDTYRDFIGDLLAQITDLHTQITKKQTELAIYDSILKQLEGQYTTQINHENGTLKVTKDAKTFVMSSAGENTIKIGYDSAFSLARKAEFIIRHSNGKLLSTREICNEILDLEPDYLTSKEITFDKLQKYLAATLVQKVDQGKMFYRKEVNGEYKYGLK